MYQLEKRSHYGSSLGRRNHLELVGEGCRTPLTEGYRHSW